jgi:ATP-dependent helicase/nuclease subunit B
LIHYFYGVCCTLTSAVPGPAGTTPATNLGLVPPTLRTTRYGPEALQALAAVIRDAKAAEPLAPVTVVVPTNHVGVAARRALARGVAGPLTNNPAAVGSIAVTYLTVFRLAELLGAARLAGQDRRPVATAVLGAAMRTALREDPGIFAPVATHPATEQALVATYRELSELPATALDKLAGASQRARDTVRLVRAARAALRHDWHDEHDLVTAALEELSQADHSELGHVVVHLPQELTRNQARLLQGVAERRPMSVVAGLTGDPEADRAVHRALGALQVSDPPAADDGSLWPVTAATTRIVTTTDPDQEVRTAVGALVDAARDGKPLERLAVLHPLDEPYARLLHEHLTAAGLPTNGPTPRPLADHAYGRTLLKLLRLPATGYRRAEMLDLFTSVPLHTPSLAASSADWERLARDAAVVAGRDHWDRRLGTLADRLDRAAPDPSPEWDTPAVDADAVDRGPARTATVTVAEVEATTRHHRRRAERARELRRYVLDLVDTLDDADAGARAWCDRIAWLRRTADLLLGNATDRSLWPAEEQKAAARVDAALDRLALLDSLDEPCTLDQFTRTLELELEADLGRHGRFGEGVLVAPLSFGVGLDLDLLVVVGLADGSLPAQPADDALLPDAERVLAGGDLRLRREHTHRQRRQLMAALASADRHLLLAPRGDLRASTDRTVSHWLHEMRRSTDPTPPVEHQPSFAHRITSTQEPATPQELRLHHVGDTSGAGKINDLVTARGQAVLRARGSDDFTRYDGNLTHAVADLPPPPTDDVISTTRLEEWARCPHAYFVRYVLGAQPVEDPDDQLTIAPRDRGALLHEILDTFVSETLPTAAPGASEGGSEPDNTGPPIPILWSDADRQRLRKLALGICERYEAAGRTGHPLYWRHERTKLVDLLDRFLSADNLHRRQSARRPVASELGFGRSRDRRCYPRRRVRSQRRCRSPAAPTGLSAPVATRAARSSPGRAARRCASPRARPAARCDGRPRLGARRTNAPGVEPKSPSRDRRRAARRARPIGWRVLARSRYVDRATRRCPRARGPAPRPQRRSRMPSAGAPALRHGRRRARRTGCRHWPARTPPHRADRGRSACAGARARSGRRCGYGSRSMQECQPADRRCRGTTSNGTTAAGSRTRSAPARQTSVRCRVKLDTRCRTDPQADRPSGRRASRSTRATARPGPAGPGGGAVTDHGTRVRRSVARHGCGGTAAEAAR